MNRKISLPPSRYTYTLYGPISWRASGRRWRGYFSKLVLDRCFYFYLSFIKGFSSAAVHFDSNSRSRAISNSNNKKPYLQYIFQCSFFLFYYDEKRNMCCCRYICLTRKGRSFYFYFYFFFLVAWHGKTRRNWSVDPWTCGPVTCVMYQPVFFILFLYFVADIR